MLPKYFNSLWIFSSFSLLVVSTVNAASSDGSDHVAVTGTQSGLNAQSGARPFRRNILDLQNDVPAWSLFVQALTAFQSADEGSELSYYQIAGVHGRPFITWNNINQVQGSSWGGYCTHSSVLFPTWHRPYLALFEQLLNGYAQDIAKQYTDPSYQNAADNLRIPYWDWASQPDIPDILNQATVQITTPSGVQSVSNPLLQYTFQKFPLDPSEFPDSALARDRHTVRSPDTATSESNPATANAALEKADLMQRTWSALVKSTDFDAFSTTAVPGSSIEAVHNDIHNDVGGSYGHMTSLEYSAFDPIFWLHHTNVDRLFAMWHAVNPDAAMTPLTEPGTYALARNSVDTVDTALLPFTSDSEGTAYTSASSLDTKGFGYAYPEIEDWHQSADDLKANVSAQINQMYDPNGMFSNNRARSTSDSSLEGRSALIPGSTIREWSAAIQISKFAVNGEYFSVRFFLGDVPSNPITWALSPNCVGSIHVMPPPHTGDEPAPTVVMYDEINLVKAVAESGNNSEDVSAVVKYLVGSLQWRVQKLDGTVVDNDQVSSLKVTVYDEVVKLPKVITELPKYGNKTLHPEITTAKPGGYGNSTASRK